MLASTLSLCAVGPATVLSHKCDILSLLKDDQNVRDNRLRVHCRHLASRRHRTAIPVATQMSLPPVCLPLFKCAQTGPQQPTHPVAWRPRCVGGHLVRQTVPLTRNHQQFSTPVQSMPRFQESALADEMNLDDRQITHLICVGLEHLLYDFV